MKQGSEHIMTEGPISKHPAGQSEREKDRYVRHAVIAASVGYALDGFDLLILGFMLSAVVTGLHLNSTQAGSLVTWTLIGAVMGGIAFGILSDYIGRVRALTWTILVFALFTGLCASAQGYWDLLIYRTMAGLGLGGEFGIGMALATEACRPHQRARISSYVGLGWQIGVLAAALLTPLLLPLIGWRGMFTVGILPAMVAFFMRTDIDEPEIFTTQRENPKRHCHPLSYLVANVDNIRASIGIIILCSVQNFGYYGLTIWMPNYLSHQFHYSLTKSALWTAATVIGMALGIWMFGQSADRLGRRPTFLGYQVGAIVMVLIYSQLSSPIGLLIGGAMMGLFVNGMMGGYGALIAELFPTQARATAQNVLFNIGRAIGGLGPLVVGALASHYSFKMAIALLAAIYVLDILAILFLIPERKGVPLETL